MTINAPSNLSPFTLGTTVAIVREFGPTLSDVVMKVYKNGNFVLGSEPGQQWKPFSRYRTNNEGRTWAANRTGDNRYRTMVYEWNAETQAFLDAKKKKEERKRKLIAVQNAISRIHPANEDDALIDGLGNVLATIAIAHMNGENNDW